MKSAGSKSAPRRQSIVVVTDLPTSGSREEEEEEEMGAAENTPRNNKHLAGALGLTKKAPASAKGGIWGGL